VADFYGKSYNLAASIVGNQVWGLGGADKLTTGSGDDFIVGNTAHSPLNHVSRVGSTGSPNGSYGPTVSADGNLVAFDAGWTGFGSQNNIRRRFREEPATGTTNEHKDGGELARAPASGDFRHGQWLFSGATRSVPGARCHDLRQRHLELVEAVSTTANDANVAPTTGRRPTAVRGLREPCDQPGGGANGSHDDIHQGHGDRHHRASTSPNGTDANATARREDLGRWPPRRLLELRHQPQQRPTAYHADVTSGPENGSLIPHRRYWRRLRREPRCGRGGGWCSRPAGSRRTNNTTFTPTPADGFTRLTRRRRPARARQGMPAPATVAGRVPAAAADPVARRQQRRRDALPGT
jgi:hypothetical protein